MKTLRKTWITIFVFVLAACNLSVNNDNVTMPTVRALATMTAAATQQGTQSADPPRNGTDAAPTFSLATGTQGAGEEAQCPPKSLVYPGFTKAGGVLGKSNFADWLRAHLDSLYGIKFSDAQYKDWWNYYYEQKDPRNPNKTSDPVYQYRLTYAKNQEGTFDLSPHIVTICQRARIGVPAPK